MRGSAIACSAIAETSPVALDRRSVMRWAWVSIRSLSQVFWRVTQRQKVWPFCVVSWRSYVSVAMPSTCFSARRSTAFTMVWKHASPVSWMVVVAVKGPRRTRLPVRGSVMISQVGRRSLGLDRAA